ncbi:MAG: acyltransferase domain-containing protein [Actinobacteria bacterium]|uniref:[acyl-carrier-protein] S-malonyltransferase n=1 Tax=freshwater metagenome TaxID=449393 RepID=A0A6J6CAH6_9ZZZZ|nr:acyltransferase domain-containing protein [Actinomycetota bacterium]MTA91775.1 acyltransferase domain-containing protein [Actinomycetota bacterium]
MIVIVCPGQGSQTPGFFTPWLELPSFRKSIEAMQDASGVDLITHGTISDAETIRDTAIAQPLIVAAGVATMSALLDGKTLKELGIAGISGHSVGEITAAVGAGILDAETGICFVNTRGQAMAKAAALEPTSMAAIIGGDQSEIEVKLAALDLEPANYNGAGQIVAAGQAQKISDLQADPPAGARVIPLQVAGAFHTRFMQPAVEVLSDYSKGISANDPELTLWSNQQGQVVASGDDFIKLMVSQISSPVRWDYCMKAMLDAGVSAMIELSPAGTLVGLAKRAMPGVETLAVKTPENLEQALSLIDKHR